MRESTEDWLSQAELLEMLELASRGRALRDFAAELGGVPYQFLGQVLNGKKHPGDKIPAALGYEAVTVYRPIQSKKTRAK